MARPASAVRESMTFRLSFSASQNGQCIARIGYRPARPNAKAGGSPPAFSTDRDAPNALPDWLALSLHCAGDYFAPMPDPVPDEHAAPARSFLVQKFSRLSLGQYSLVGYSVAGEETVVQVPELNTCFDIGRCPY